MVVLEAVVEKQAHVQGQLVQEMQVDLHLLKVMMEEMLFKAQQIQEQGEVVQEEQEALIILEVLRLEVQEVKVQTQV
tara:strand:- start:227 stop:457 length:231 start_codon:yes stop_codon:yes gene_type:complete